MPLLLTLTDRNGRSNLGTRTLVRGSLSIGRASGNDWVLDDPERQLSKTHCMISVEAGRFILMDVSTNGVYINGASTPTTRDSRTVISPGDEFRLGDYRIRVAEAPSAPAPLAGDPFDMDFSATAPASPFGGTGSGAADPLGFDPLDDAFGGPPPAPFLHPPPGTPPLRAIDPFDLAADSRHEGGPPDDLFDPRPAGDAWRGPSQRDNADAPRLAFTPPKAVAQPRFDDLDIDALLGDMPIPGQPAARPAAPLPRPASNLPDDLDDLLGDAPFGMSPTPPPQPTSPQPAPAPRQATASSDLDDLLGDSPFGAAPVIAEPAPVRPVAAPPPIPVPQAPRAAVPAPSGNASALLAAFLQGAGVPDLPLGSQDQEATMRAAGEVFRIMVEGLREVLMSRAAIKNELRVEQTVLRAKNNNALKFSVTPEEAVAALLAPNRPGYKPPLEAAKEAFDDIRSHELAVMAGVQTALMGLLKRFDPATLETRLQPGRLDSIMPAARKARFWELFCVTYKDLAREAEDDFQSVFGREFARAYDAQARKL
jgi:type VI secretion system protein